MYIIGAGYIVFTLRSFHIITSTRNQGQRHCSDVVSLGRPLWGTPGKSPLTDIQFRFRLLEISSWQLKTLTTQEITIVLPKYHFFLTPCRMFGLYVCLSNRQTISFFPQKKRFLFFYYGYTSKSLEQILPTWKSIIRSACNIHTIHYSAFSPYKTLIIYQHGKQPPLTLAFSTDVLPDFKTISDQSLNKSQYFVSIYRS